MRRLYLHVGHPKTGSSWLQASLLQSQGRLREHSICYPAGRDAARALEGKTTSGNGTGLLISPSDFERRIDAESVGHSDSVLFSSEVLFREAIRLLDDGLVGPMRDAIDNAKRKHGFAEVSCFLFIRNPIDWIASYGQQFVKAGGDCDLMDYVEQLGGITPKIEDFIQVANALDLNVTIRNYSNHKADVLAPVCEWLGVPANAIAPYRRQRVNRSLTRSEVELLRRVNGRAKHPSKDLGFKLVDEVPDVETDGGKIPSEHVELLYRKFRPQIEKLNEKIEQSEQYPVAPPVLNASSDEDQTFEFDDRQLDVIAEVLASERDAAFEARAEVEELKKQLGYGLLAGPSRAVSGLVKALRGRKLQS